MTDFNAIEENLELHYTKLQGAVMIEAGLPYEIAVEVIDIEVDKLAELMKKTLKAYWKERKP